MASSFLGQLPRGLQRPVFPHVLAPSRLGARASDPEHLHAGPPPPRAAGVPLARLLSLSCLPGGMRG